MNAYDIIRRPVITEQSMEAVADKKYVFMVDVNAAKPEIKAAIGVETDDYRACCLNVRHSMELIEHSLQIHSMEEREGLRVIGAVYHIDSGKVDFI